MVLPNALCSGGLIKGRSYMIELSKAEVSARESHFLLSLATRKLKLASLPNFSDEFACTPSLAIFMAPPESNQPTPPSSLPPLSKPSFSRSFLPEASDLMSYYGPHDPEAHEDEPDPADAVPDPENTGFYIDREASICLMANKR